MGSSRCRSTMVAVLGAVVLVLPGFFVGAPAIAAAATRPASLTATAPSTSVTMYSDPGDWVGAAEAQEFDTANATIGGTLSTNAIGLDVDGGTAGTQFNFNIAAAPGQPLTTGFYTGVQREEFRTAGHPGLDIFGDGRGCNTDGGQFDVRDLVSSGTTITRLDLLYEQHCENGVAALFGEIRIAEPGPASALVSSGAITWPAVATGLRATPGSVWVRNPSTVGIPIGTAILGGADHADFGIQSDSCSGTTLPAHGSCLIAVYDQPTVQGPRTATLQLGFPSGTDTIQLDSQDVPGLTSLHMVSQPGDYIGGGETYSFGPPIAARGSDTGLEFTTNGWEIDLAPATGEQLTPGTFPGATRYPFNGSGNGLTVMSPGRGCNTSIGSFTITEADYSPVDGSLERFDASFVQHCEGATPALTGEIKYQSSPGPLPPPGVTGLIANPNGSQATLSWTNPAGANYAYTVVRIEPGAMVATSPVAGTAVASGRLTSAVASGLQLGQTYTVSAFAVDIAGEVSGPTQIVVTTAAGFVPLPPTRVLDTRTTDVPPSWAPGTPVGPGQTVTLPVASVDGVPADATAAVLNVTATDVTSPTFVTVHPDGVPTATSNLNLVPGDTRANLVTVALGANGVVDLTNSAGDVDLLVDLAGYYDAGGADLYSPLAPTRVLDTRTSTVPPGWAAGQPLGAGGTLDLPVAGVDGVPADAAAVVVNITAVDPSAGTYLTAYPTGGSPPVASNVNAGTGAIVPNLAVVKVGSGGDITLFNFAGDTHVVVDVVGAYGPSGADLFVPASPTRLLDTRTNNVPSGWAAGHPLGPDGTLTLPVAGAAVVPANAVAAVINLTGTAATASTFVTAYPAGSARPLASDLNLLAGETRPNLASVSLGSAGGLALYNQSGSVHVVVDLFGFFVPTPTSST